MKRKRINANLAGRRRAGDLLGNVKGNGSNDSLSYYMFEKAPASTADTKYVVVR